MILKAIIVMLLMSDVASASVWIEDTEIGLAAYQDNGYVSGNFVERELSTRLDYIYVPVSYLPDKYQIDTSTMKTTFVFSCTERFLNNGHSYLYCVPEGR